MLIFAATLVLRPQKQKAQSFILPDKLRGTARIVGGLAPVCNAQVSRKARLK